MRSKSPKGPFARTFASTFACPCLLTLALLGSWLSRSWADETGAYMLPSLQHLGVLPFVLEEQKVVEGQEVDGLRTPDFEGQRQLMAKFFPEVLRSSQRFHVLHDDLVAGLWSSVAGRKELLDEYELSAYMHLQVSLTSDLAIFTIRLLGPQLQPYMQEGEIWQLQKLRLATASELQEGIRDLTFRLLNRLPVDISVTSVQGTYVTLSGGRMQGLALGSKLDLVRAWVNELHPTLQTWRNFRIQNLGRAKVVDLQGSGAIAQLEELVGAESVGVGDGLKSSQIPSRVYFSRRGSTQPSGFKPLNPDANSIIAQGFAPIPRSQPWKDALEPSPAFASVEEPPVVSSAPVAPSAGGSDENSVEHSVEHSIEQTEEKEVPAVEEKVAEEKVAEEKIASPQGLTSQWYRPDLSSYLPYFADEVALQLGAWGWTATGTSSGASKWTWYQLVNRLNVELRREIVPQLHMSLGAGVGFGKTRGNKGGFFAYEGLGRLVWEEPVTATYSQLFAGLKSWTLGGQLLLSGLGVSGSSFGGYDSVEVGLVGGLKGLVHIGGATEDPYEWMAELTVLPVHLMGRVAYNKVTETLHHSTAWQLLALGYEELGPRRLEWGAGASLGGQSVSSAAGEHTALSHYTAYLLARVRM